MTTTELIKKVHKIASVFLEVTQINFDTHFTFSDMSESMNITIFYEAGGIERNLSVWVYSWKNQAYSVNTLLKEVEAKLEEFNINAIKSVEVK